VPLIGRKTNFELIVDSKSSTNPKSFAKIGPVDTEKIGPTELIKNK